MTSKTARLLTRDVRYLETGEGRPIVFLHAFPLGASQWLPQLSKLPAGWRGVAPDLRGLGASSVDLPVDQVTIETYADDVLELMAHVDMPRAVVCGLSMGGYVAFAMLRRAPSRILGLVLADTRAGADSDDGRAGRDRMIDLVKQDGPAGVSKVMLPKLLGETTRRLQPDLVEVVHDSIVRNRTDGIVAALRAMRNRPSAVEQLPAIACPTLIMVGEEDELTPPSEAEAMREAVPSAELVTLAEAGHLSNLEAPAAFSNALYGWLARLPRPA